MKGYKAFNNDWTCRGFKYEIGKTYELSEGETLKMCECGFHFCENPIDVFGYYPFSEYTKIAEVEAIGKIEQQGTKYCTDRIKIVKEFTHEELQAQIRDGHYNSGDYNSGDYNSGDYNSGDRNSGDRNSGDYNSGDYNSGDRNSGDYNSGDYNSGRFNSGDCNSGDYNSGDYNSGMFNTDEPRMRAFNRETSVRYSDFVRSLDYYWDGLLKRINEKKLIYGDAEKIRGLPNFDADIFFEITGIDLSDEK